VKTIKTGESWPPVALIPDATRRAEMRNEVLTRIGREFDSVSPLTDLTISMEDFEAAVGRIKAELIAEARS